MFQINKSYDCVWDEEMYFVSKYTEDGYQGRTTDTTYEDGIGISYTDWCVESGFSTREEAQARADFLSSISSKKKLDLY